MSIASDTREFLDAIDAFAQAVRRARGAPAQAGEDALSLSQYALILGLRERDCARVLDLAADAGVTPSTATRILDVLERRGIVRRRRTPEDRRSVLVSLTESGREVLEARHEWQRTLELSFYAALPDVERELAPDLLLRLAGLIDELAAGPEG
jgi:MarR family transcriptional regulator, organic hydroperoxide resistance regulator